MLLLKPLVLIFGNSYQNKLLLRIFFKLILITWIVAFLLEFISAISIEIQLLLQYTTITKYNCFSSFFCNNLNNDIEINILIILNSLFIFFVILKVTLFFLLKNKL